MERLNVSDRSFLEKEHRFVVENHDAAIMRESWEGRMALKYDAKLFKEYALIDLTHWQDQRYGLRWRTESEVRSRKGQAFCGNVTKNEKCSSMSNLSTFELNFAYIEHGVQKHELVKVRLCGLCSKKMGSKRTIKEQQKCSSVPRKSNESDGYGRSSDKHDVRNQKSSRKREAERKEAEEEEGGGGGGGGGGERIATSDYLPPDMEGFAKEKKRKAIGADYQAQLEIDSDFDLTEQKKTIKAKKKKKKKKNRKEKKEDK